VALARAAGIDRRVNIALLGARYTTLPGLRRGLRGNCLVMSERKFQSPVNAFCSPRRGLRHPVAVSNAVLVARRRPTESGIANSGHFGRESSRGEEGGCNSACVRSRPY
jgi:hypothetical protein